MVLMTQPLTEHPECTLLGAGGTNVKTNPGGEAGIRTSASFAKHWLMAVNSVREPGGRSHSPLQGDGDGIPD